MIQFLEAIPTGAGAVIILLVLVGGLFTAIYRGLIIPRPQHEDRVADIKEQRDNYRDGWHEAQAGQIEAVENTRTIVQMLEGMQENDEGGRRQ